MAPSPDPAALAARLERLEETLLELVTALGLLVSELALREDLALSKPEEVERALERGWTALVDQRLAARTTGSAAELEAVAARVLRRAMETTRAAFGAIYHVPADASESVLVAYEGFPAEVMETYRVVRHDAPLPVSAVAASGRPIWFEDRTAILDSYPNLERATEQTEAALGGDRLQSVVMPLRVDSRVVAVLLVGFTRPGGLEAADGPVRELEEQSARALAAAEGSGVRRDSAG